MLQLFATAQKLGIAEEIDLENKLAIRLLKYVTKNTELLIYREDLYKPIRNVMYIIEIYITSLEFKNSGQNLLDIVNIINYNKRGMTDLIQKSEKNLQRRISEIKRKLDIAKSKVLKISSAYGYLKLIKNLEATNKIYASYINYRELLYKSPVVITTILLPMFVKDNIGFNALEQMASDLLIELEILEIFSKKAINKLVLRYININDENNFDENLFNLVITNYLFSNVCNSNPKSLEIDVIDAKIILSEILRGKLSAKEIIKDAIIDFEDDPTKIKYIKQIEKIVDLKIKSIKKRRKITGEFIVSI